MRVLVAEDNAVSRRWLQVLLGKWGYEVTLATNGLEAWQALVRDDPPELAIVDWMMPEMTGVEVCSRCRAANLKDYTYIILLSAKGEKEDIVQGLDSGADDYLVKPIEQAELRARMRVGQRSARLHRELQRRIEETESLLRRHQLLGKMFRKHTAAQQAQQSGTPGLDAPGQPRAVAGSGAGPNHAAQSAATPSPATGARPDQAAAAPSSPARTAGPAETPPTGATRAAARHAPPNQASTDTASKGDGKPAPGGGDAAAGTSGGEATAPAAPAAESATGAAADEAATSRVELDAVIDVVIRGLLPIGIGAVSPVDVSILDDVGEMEFTAWSGLAVLDQGLWIDLKLEMTREAATALFRAVQGDQEPSDRDVLDALGEAMHLIDVNFNDHFYRAKNKALTPLVPKAILSSELPDLPQPEQWQPLAFSMGDHVIRFSVASTEAPVVNRDPADVDLQDLLVEALKPPSAKGRALIKAGALLDIAAVKKIAALSKAEGPGWTIPVLTPSALCRELYAS